MEIAMSFMDKIKEFAEDAKTQFNKYNNRTMMKGTMSALAMIVDANGAVKDEEMQTVTQLVMRDEDLKCYDFAEMMKVFKDVHSQFEINKYAGEGVALANIGKITDKAAGRILVGKVCAIAASDGDFDENEKDSARKICNTLTIHPGEFDL
jgi:tellurite resistance protein TerB